MEISDSEFKKEVEECGGVVLVDFWGSWCPPCKRIQVVLEKLEKEVGTKICGLNINKNPLMAEKYDVFGVPTLVVFRDGREEERSVGSVTEGQIREMLERAKNK